MRLSLIDSIIDNKDYYDTKMVTWYQLFRMSVDIVKKREEDYVPRKKQVDKKLKTKTLTLLI